jgi:hypothetical protein
MRLGELQAQVARLDGLGERLAGTAGLKPSDLPGLAPGSVPGRGGAPSTRPARDLSMREFSRLLEELTRQVDARADQYGLLEALLLQDSAKRKSSCRRSRGREGHLRRRTPSIW